MKRIAECCCGEISITVEDEPLTHAVCHCANCRKRTGSAFGISAYFDKKQVIEKKGTPSCYTLHHKQLDHDQERYFCSRCGTTLYWLISTMPDHIGISGGCFTQAPLGEPSMAVSVGQKYPWLSIPAHWDISE